MTPENNNLAIEDTKSLTLAEKLANKKRSNKTGEVALLLDESSSMSIFIEPGKSRIQALMNIVKDIPGDPFTIAFASDCRIISKSEALTAGGGTSMASAFKLAKENGYDRVMIVTDGEAGDPTAALIEATGMDIGIMYVGSGDPPEFLQKLAALSGHVVTAEDLKKQKEITGKLTLLLGAGSDNKDPDKIGGNKGPIIL